MGHRSIAIYDGCEVNERGLLERRINMDTIAANLAYFKEKHAEVYRAYQDYGRTLHEEGGPLEEKMRWLIKVSISTTCQMPYALKTHIKKALKSGASREEIEHAILLTAPTAGFPRMMEGILILREVLGETEKQILTE